MDPKDVIVSIIGIQQYEHSYPEVTELITTGTYTYSEGHSKLSYVDTESDSENRPTNTTIQIDKGRVFLSREGAVNSQILFQEGKRNYSLYQTDVGSLMVGVGVNRMRTKLDAHGGEIELDYSIEIDHAIAGFNRFSIKIKEAMPTGSSYETQTKLKN
jgi:uncharacterized beta-barrel protein YwiB (DUF1934 family)